MTDPVGVPSAPRRIDMHCHVGLLGDRYPQWGRISEWLRRQITYRVFLLYARIPEDQVSDRKLEEVTLALVDSMGLDGVVFLALDPVYDERGRRAEDRSNLWVDNEYVLHLRQTVGGNRVVFGASVHPYDPAFENRVRRCVDQGAVLLKWLPSAQQINLADSRVQSAIRFLATARDGRPLPLLLHVGPEYAIPSTDPRTTSYDYLSWSSWDRFWNAFRRQGKWHEPNLTAIHANLRAGLDAGATIIFAHCGLPYFAGRLGRWAEHSDFSTVSEYLSQYPTTGDASGRCYADVSACATPFRKTYFGDIEKLPRDSLLFGSDFPTPVFELSADLGEIAADFKAVLQGDLTRIIIPQDNLLDVNYRELQHAFPGHPMFTRFNSLL